MAQRTKNMSAWWNGTGRCRERDLYYAPAYTSSRVRFPFAEKEADATVRTLVEAKAQSDKPFVVRGSACRSTR